MNLAVLAIMVASGIGLTVTLVHLTGGSRRAVLQDEVSAVRRFSLDFPDRHVGKVFLTDDGYTAFLTLPHARVGIVHAIGSKFLTRVVGEADLMEAPHASAKAVSLRFRDVTWGGGSFTFSDTASANAVLDLFRPFSQHAIPEQI